LFLLPIVQAAKDQPVGVGVRHNLPHFAYHDLLRIPGQAGELGFWSLPAVGVPGGRFLGHRQTYVADLFHLESGKSQAAR
jgi:hypothetical protein